jgi:hypothetical protein
MAGPPLTLGGYWGAKYQGSAHPVRWASFEFSQKRIERPEAALVINRLPGPLFAGR